MVDTLDELIVSPFQAWFAGEIMTKSSSSINVLAKRNQVMPPSPVCLCELYARWNKGHPGDIDRFVDRDTMWRMGSAKALSYVVFQLLLVADPP